MDAASNDNPAPAGAPQARPVRIIGQVDADTGRVTITDPTWRAAPGPARLMVLEGGRNGRPEP